MRLAPGAVTGLQVDRRLSNLLVIGSAALDKLHVLSNLSCGARARDSEVGAGEMGLTAAHVTPLSKAIIL